MSGTGVSPVFPPPGRRCHRSFRTHSQPRRRGLWAEGRDPKIDAGFDPTGDGVDQIIATFAWLLDSRGDPDNYRSCRRGCPVRVSTWNVKTWAEPVDAKMRCEQQAVEAMEQQTRIQTVAPAEVIEARPPGAVAGVTPYAKPPVDRCAMASAVCGVTAIVPVISQVAGLVLGIIAIRRIRRARRAGFAAAGLGWATTGIVSSIFVLLGWVFVVVIFGVVVSIFSDAAAVLDKAVVVPPR